MKANLNLGSLFGIKIIAHWTFFLLILWVVFDELKRGGTTQSILFNVAFVLAVFMCVVLHELGHALMARRFKVNTKTITLLPIGGMASLDKIPESPKQEFLVVIAGPLVNVAIAIIIYLIIPIKALVNIKLVENLESLNDFTFQDFLLYLFIVNVGLVIFNAIPAFPMDGGRILRALLAMKIDRVNATQIASGIGQAFALVFLLVGLLYNPFLIFIALFIFLGAYSENQMVLHLSLLKGHTCEDAMMINITVFKPEDSLDIVVDKIIYGTENNFVVVKDSTIVGLLFHKDIIDYSNKNLLVKDIMDTNFKVLNVDDDLKKVYSLMLSRKNAFFPVVENKKLVGAIDRINLNEYILLQSKLAY